MAKKSSVEKNNRRRGLVSKNAAKRAALKATIRDQEVPMEERFKATLKLAELPRDGSKTRILISTARTNGFSLFFVSVRFKNR